jgi:predicted MPP superfamily phosphohydrolase
VRLPGLPPVLPELCAGFVAGWYAGLAAPLYVSRGVGTSGLPIRFMCPAEVPIFTFRRA